MGGGGQLNTQNRKTEGDALLPEGPPAGPSRECGCRPCPPLRCKLPGLPPCPQHLAWRLSPRRASPSPAPGTPGPSITPQTRSHEALQTELGEFRKGDSGTRGPPTSSHPGLGPGRHRASGHIREPTGAGSGGRSSGRGGGRPAPRLQAPPGRGEELREAGPWQPLWAPFPALRGGAGGSRGGLLLPQSPPPTSASFATLRESSKDAVGAFPAQGKLVPLAVSRTPA